MLWGYGIICPKGVRQKSPIADSFALLSPQHSPTFSHFTLHFSNPIQINLSPQLFHITQPSLTYPSLLISKTTGTTYLRRRSRWSAPATPTDCKDGLGASSPTGLHLIICAHYYGSPSTLTYCSISLHYGHLHKYWAPSYPMFDFLDFFFFFYIPKMIL